METVSGEAPGKAASATEALAALRKQFEETAENTKNAEKVLWRNNSTKGTLDAEVRHLSTCGELEIALFEFFAFSAVILSAVLGRTARSKAEACRQIRNKAMAVISDGPDSEAQRMEQIQKLRAERQFADEFPVSL